MLGWLALIVAALAGLFVLVQSQSGEMSAATAGLTAATVIAMLAGIYAAAHRSRWNDNRLAQAIIAAVIMTGLAAAAWWLGADHLPGALSGAGKPAAGDLAVGQAVRQAGAVSVLIRKSSDGKFVTQGRINAIDAALLIDTGASAVMLKHSDAEKAGIDVEALSFTTPVQTANGTIYAAPVRVRSITIGLLRLDDIEALVAKPGSLNENLLGMSFLRRLTSYDLKGDFLTLRE